VEKGALWGMTHYRIPKPVKTVVEVILKPYRQLVVGRNTFDQQLLRRVEDAINSSCPGEVSELRVGFVVARRVG